MRIAIHGFESYFRQMFEAEKQAQTLISALGAKYPNGYWVMDEFVAVTPEPAPGYPTEAPPRSE